MVPVATTAPMSSVPHPARHRSPSQTSCLGLWSIPEAYSSRLFVLFPCGSYSFLLSCWCWWLNSASSQRQLHSRRHRYLRGGRYRWGIHPQHDTGWLRFTAVKIRSDSIKVLLRHDQVVITFLIKNATKEPSSGLVLQRSIILVCISNVRKTFF